jgi:hypothetical protein
MSQVEITYFSDVLSDWAYVGEAVRIEHRPAFSRA